MPIRFNSILNNLQLRLRSGLSQFTDGGGVAKELNRVPNKKQTVSISDFKSKTLAAFARPSLYEVRITPPPGFGITNAMNPDIQVINLNCYNAQIPGVSIATTDKDIGYRSIPYQKLYDDVLLSFYCRENFADLEFMQDWINLISNPVNNRFEYYTEYVSTIDIINISKDNKKTLTTTLHEAYPKKIDPMALDYGSTDLLRMTVSFTYRHFTQVWGDKEKTETGSIEVSKNLKAIHRNESDESFRERMGIKVAPENQLKKTFPRGQFDN